MFDTDEVAVGRVGIRLNEGHFRALGLQGGSRCWGVWVEGRGGREKMAMTDERLNLNTRSQGPHLVLSPIHPDLWPSTFRIEARLNRTQEALPSFISSLSRLGLNVLSLDTAIRGFELLVVEVFANIPSLSEWVSDQLSWLDQRVASLGSSKADIATRLAARMGVFSAIGARLVSCAAAIESELRLHDARAIADSRTEQGMFSKPSRWYGHQPWFLGMPGCVPVPTPKDASFHAHSAGVLDLGSLAGAGPGRAGVTAYARLLRKTSSELRRAYKAHLNLESSASRLNNDPFTEPPLGDEEAAVSLERLWEAHAKPPLMVRGLPTLSYARVWRAFDGAAVPAKKMKYLEFEVRGSLLECLDPEDGEGANETRGANGHDFAQLGGVRRQLYALAQQNTPHDDREPPENWLGRWSALASLHHEERSIRLRFLRPWFSRKYAWELEIPYRIGRLVEAGPGAGPIGAAGLLTELVRRMTWFKTAQDCEGVPGQLEAQEHAPSPFHIENITNTLTRSGPSEEVGLIRMIVIPERLQGAESERPAWSRPVQTNWVTELEVRSNAGVRAVQDFYRRIGLSVEVHGKIRVACLHDQMERNW